MSWIDPVMEAKAPSLEDLSKTANDWNLEIINS